MKSFLAKISELGAVTNVILLSSQGGELLFASNGYGSEEETSRWQTCWKVVIAGLDDPETADFIFDNGRYYLRRTTVGWLIVGMRSDTDLNRVRIACDSVAKKLLAPELRQQTLLKLLHQTEDGLKPHVIKELMATADRRFGMALIGLLDKRSSFDNSHRSRLLLLICQALGYCRYPQAIGYLQEFLATDTPPAMIANAARVAIRQLEEFGARQPQTAGPSSPPQVVDTRNSLDAAEKKSVQAHNDPQRIIPTSRQVREALQRGAREEAAQLLTVLIRQAADSRDFAKTDQLHEWLAEVAPWAANSIGKSDTMILQAKQAAIPPAHLDLWKPLIDLTGPEAFACLYHRLSRQQHVTGDLIAYQGELRPALFFIIEGNVALEIVCGDTEKPLVTLGPGQVFGADSFFHPTVWTMNARSLGVDLLVLAPEDFQLLERNHPELGQQLARFCAHPAVPPSPLNNRRQTGRFAASNLVTIMAGPMSQSADHGQLQGRLIDISRYGLALGLRGVQQSVAESLLGSLLYLDIRSGKGSGGLSRSGAVKAIGIVNTEARSYLLHVELLEALSEVEMQILGIETQWVDQANQ